jgi:hypothetical protein
MILFKVYALGGTPFEYFNDGFSSFGINNDPRTARVWKIWYLARHGHFFRPAHYGVR